MNDNLRISTRKSIDMSDRGILANALESSAQNDKERRKLRQYKAKIEILNQAEVRLRELRERIRELSSVRDAYDTTEVKRLQNAAKRLANRINTYDKQLLSLESSVPLMAILKREREIVMRRAEERSRAFIAEQRDRAVAEQQEIIARYRESRAKAVAAYRNKILNNFEDE